MKRIIDVDENLICEGFVRNFTEEEKDVLINAIRYSIPYEERPQGKWIKVTKAGTVPVEYICSLCRRKIYDNYELTTPIDEFYPFCHCGADMRKGGAK